MDVQTANRKQSTNTHCHYFTHTLQINTFPAVCGVCCDTYWEATAPLTSTIDRPALPLRLTGKSAGRERGTFKRQSLVSWSVYGLISPSECLYSEVYTGSLIAGSQRKPGASFITCVFAVFWINQTYKHFYTLNLISFSNKQNIKPLLGNCSFTFLRT